MTCGSCLYANRTGGPSVSLAIPDGGCEVFNKNSRLICTAGTEGSCPLGEQSVAQHGFIAIDMHQSGVVLLCAMQAYSL